MVLELELRCTVGDVLAAPLDHALVRIDPR